MGVSAAVDTRSQGAMTMLAMIGSLALAAAGGDTCTTLPPLMHPDGGSWEPVERSPLC